MCTAKKNVDGWDAVYQCTNSRGCELTPGTNSEWVITRRRGTITESITVVPAFDFEFNTPYAAGDYIVYFDALYECVSNRGLCSFFPPDIVNAWTPVSKNGFNFDAKFGY